MADGQLVESLKDSVSSDEWNARCDLAALYRITAMHGWDDLIFTHISFRLPGPDHHFLINPYGVLFEEMTASSLVKIDLEGNILQDTPYFVNPAGFTIHSAVHMAREDANCVMHLHTDQGCAVAAQKDGLLPITQTGMIALADLAYHDYEGIAFEHDERERIQKDLGNKHFMLLRNHGTLTCGGTMGQAYLRMFFLERACKMQIMAQSGGGELLLCDDAMQDKIKMQSAPAGTAMISDALVWPAILRRLNRHNPGYDV